MPARLDLQGRTFGRLTVVKLEQRQAGRRRWVCQCICGGETRASSNVLVSGQSQSCGCLQRERSAAAARVSSRRHGLTRTPEHYSWRGMISRCYNENATGYARYGGAGVNVCDRWRSSFQAFLSDMGPRPTAAHTLDRYPDKFGNYEPGNCRWATPEEQQNNRRDVVNGRRFDWRSARAAL